MVNVTGPSSAGDKPGAEILKAWANHVNQNGGISGHPVEVRVEDTRADASEAATIAEEFISDDSVVAVMSSTSPTEGATGELFAKADLAVGGFGYNPEVWSALPNFYTSVTTFPQLVTSQVAAAKAAEAETLGSVACAENPNCLAAIPILEESAKAASLNFAGVFKVAASAPNYTAECLSMTDDGVDFAQLSIAEDVAIRVVEDCQQQGYEGWFGASSGSVTPGLYGEVSDDTKLAGVVNGFPWWIDIPAVEEFRSVMDEQGVPESTYGSTPATGMWAALELFRTALANVKEGDEVTRATVHEGYGSIKDEDLGGLLGQPVSFTAGQPAAPMPCYWMYTFENGEFSSSDEATCEPAG
jgi:branched-chain amino acid transport system substrate-binding protein